MKTRSSSRDRILDAAEEVVADLGAGHMTMDAVVARAGLSKGGLIYHFPSLRALLQAMLKRFIEHTEARITEARARLPETPARELKAHIEGWFTLDAKSQSAQAALLVALSREPSLLKMVREKRHEIGRAILAASPDPDRVRILLLAVEGLWMTELLQLSRYTAKERLQIKHTLLKLADSSLSESKPAPRKPAPHRSRPS
jgi:AcrR family transcriptional regulator